MPSHGLTIGPPCAGSAHCPLCAIFKAAARLALVAPDSEMRSSTSGSHEQPTVMKALRSSQQLSSAVGMVSLKTLRAGQSMASISTVCFCRVFRGWVFFGWLVVWWGGRVFFVLGRARGERKAKGVREGRGTFSLESFQGRWGGGSGMGERTGDERGAVA